MFIETDEGRLQNLYLLQNVIVTESDNEEYPYCVGWVQSNGMIIKEGKYTDSDSAEAKRKEIMAELIAIE